MTQTKFNTSIQQIDRNIKHNSRLNIPWLQESKHSIFSGKLAIIGGAPSIKNKLEEIKQLKKDGVMIMAVNGTHDYLLDNDIKPDFFAMLDGRKLNNFATNPQDDCVYLLASQCHKSVFEKLKDYKVLLWHCEYEEIDKEFIRKEAIKRNILINTMISGKGCIGLTAICLGYTLGFHEFLLYGMDSSFKDKQHSYKQAQNDDDEIIEVEIDDVKYKTTKPLYAQVQTYKIFKKLLDELGCKVDMRSEGLMKVEHVKLETSKKSSIIKVT